MIISTKKLVGIRKRHAFDFSPHENDSLTHSGTKGRKGEKTKHEHEKTAQR